MSYEPGDRNELASQLNISIKEHGGSFKSSSFYQDVLRRFRKADTDNRYLLLMQLKGKEVNENYVYSRLHQPVINCLVSKNSVTVNVMTDAHPRQDKYEANCYFYKILLMQWRSLMSTEAMKIVEVGTVVKKDLELAKVAKMEMTKKVVRISEKEVRVMAKRVVAIN